jgi:hypothetical protein
VSEERERVRVNFKRGRGSRRLGYVRAAHPAFSLIRSRSQNLSLSGSRALQANAKRASKHRARTAVSDASR